MIPLKLPFGATFLQPAVSVFPNRARTDARIILVCTQNCFQSQHMARWLLQVRAVPGCQLLPVVADELFQVPRRHGDSVEFCDGVDDFVYSQVIRAVFLEVALPFIPSQCSEVDLSIRSRQLASRLYGDLRPLSAKLMMVAGGVVEQQKTPSVTDSSNVSLHLLTRPNNESDKIEGATSETDEMVMRAF